MPSYIDLPHDFPTSVLMFVDTEEEFDWTKKFDSRNRSVTALPHLRAAHEVFAKHDIVPHYMVDHPVAAAPSARDLFRSLATDHPLEIGAQLHPWVTPPHDEQLTDFNSYPGNLPEQLESAKLNTLTLAIVDAFERRPTVYKAGRYGIGPNTPGILRSQGYKVDVSARSRFDYGPSFGPDFSDIKSQPYWLDDENTLLELPASSAFAGLLAPVGGRLHDNASENGKVSLRNRLLSRLGLLSRLTLTPEGYTIDEAITCIERLRAQDAKLYSISFHSPSLEIGNTPYVRNEAEKRQLLNWLDEIVGYLTAEVAAMPSTADEIYKLLVAPE